jgi:Fe2+ or Zn2+ uptake regulation protein
VSGDDVKLIECACHGPVSWEAHMCCESCLFVFDGKAADAPSVCRCGAQLMPRGANDQEFKARAICPKCYSDRVNQQQPPLA